MFHGWFSMAERCRACGLRFEREQGYFVGAIHLNSAATILILIAASLGLYFAGASVTSQLVIAGALCVLVPLLFFRYSKSLWLAMDYFFDPERMPEAPSGRGGTAERLPALAEGITVIPHDAPVRVECYAGSRAEQAPRRLRAGDRWEDLVVLDGWVTEAAEGGTRLRWFKVRLTRGTEGLLYHDEALDLWFWRALDHSKGFGA